MIRIIGGAAYLPGIPHRVAHIRVEFNNNTKVFNGFWVVIDAGGDNKRLAIVRAFEIADAINSITKYGMDLNQRYVGKSIDQFDWISEWTKERNEAAAWLDRVVFNSIDKPNQLREN